MRAPCICGFVHFNSAIVVSGVSAFGQLVFWKVRDWIPVVQNQLEEQVTFFTASLLVLLAGLFSFKSSRCSRPLFWPLYTVCLQNSKTSWSLRVLTIVLLRQWEKKHCKMGTLPLRDVLPASHRGVLIPFSGLLKFLLSSAHNSVMAAKLPPFTQENWFLRHWVMDSRRGWVCLAVAAPKPLFSEGIEEDFLSQEIAGNLVGLAKPRSKATFTCDWDSSRNPRSI